MLFDEDDDDDDDDDDDIWLSSSFPVLGMQITLETDAPLKTHTQC
jgi:hypothetical protein